MSNKHFRRYILISVIFQFIQNVSLNECSTDSCSKDSLGDGDSSCGCSANRQHSENETPIDRKHNELKYTDSSGQTDSPYVRTNEMVLISAGSFLMGTNEPIFVADGEGPQRKVTLSKFYLDKYEVSNAEFEIFTNSTEYETEVCIPLPRFFYLRVYCWQWVHVE